MHKMMILRDNLMDELEKFADKPLTEQSLEYVDKLAHAIKCIDTVSAMERAEQDGGYSGRTYRDGCSTHRSCAHAPCGSGPRHCPRGKV